MCALKLHSQITINGRTYVKGADVSWAAIYPFFLIHMLVFGISGFVMAYGASAPDAWFLYMHGGIAITAYVGFYLAIFGVDEVKWMFINAALGIAGIYTQVDWILKRFDKNIDAVPWHVHVIPFSYYMLYVFLIRNAFLDLLGAREDESRRAMADKAYIAVSVAICLVFFLLDR